jgi:RNA polymerase sigma-70 factor (ECF subfamily)
MDGIIERDLRTLEMHIETTLDTTTPPRMAESEFAGLYELHYRDVYRYVLALTRSRDEAEDVAAEAFERAYRSWTSERIDRGRALPWLLLTARRIVTDRWRRVRRLSHLLPGVRRPDEDAAEHSRTEFWLWFDALCRALPERQREVLVLRYQRDLSDADIGSIMELSESGVRSLSARALTSLRGHPELLS